MCHHVPSFKKGLIVWTTSIPKYQISFDIQNETSLFKTIYRASQKVVVQSCIKGGLYPFSRPGRDHLELFEANLQRDNVMEGHNKLENIGVEQLTMPSNRVPYILSFTISDSKQA